MKFSPIPLWKLRSSTVGAVPIIIEKRSHNYRNCSYAIMGILNGYYAIMEIVPIVV